MNKGVWDIVRAQFVTSAVKAEQYPSPQMIEAAFIGRSNVGKSSLINSLCRRNGLARVSATPGKTQTINYYLLNAKRNVEGGADTAQFYLVDLPGYGFAKTGKSNKDLWSGFISKYLSGSDNLALVCQLIDIRHKPMESDITTGCWAAALTCRLFSLKPINFPKMQPWPRKPFLNANLGLMTAAL